MPPWISHTLQSPDVVWWMFNVGSFIYYGSYVGMIALVIVIIISVSFFD